MMKKKIDPTLLELWIGILAYGIVFELALLLLARDPAYGIGLWIGIFLALAGAFHMWWSLNRGLELPQKAAVKSVSTQNIIRYVAIAAALAVLMCTNLRIRFLHSAVIWA